MAPPDWVLEKRLSPEERKRQARLRTAKVLTEHAKEAESGRQEEPALANVVPAGDARNPMTPALGVDLPQLQLTTSQAEKAWERKRKRARGRDDVDENVPDGPSHKSVPDRPRRGSLLDGFRSGSAAGPADAPSIYNSDQNNSGQAQSPELQISKRVQPKWYTSLTQRRLQDGRGDRNVEAKLEQVKDLIKQCKTQPNKQDMGRLFDRIRDELHDLVFLQVTAVALRRKRMLHDDSGLPQLFDENLAHIPFPWDIRADALELYTRWVRQDFAIDLLRGIIKRAPGDGVGNRSTDRIDPRFPGKTKADYYGGGALINGQWWPTQLCTVRDGAHGATQGGIYANKGKPAYSIILSGGNHYKDRDDGHEIWYSGTDGKDGKVSENTQSLMLNKSAAKEVRVIRSHNLSQRASAYRPPRGFRYDGCYEVLDWELVDQSKMAYLFHLRRLPNQDPIRFQGKEMRPTEAEIREYDKVKGLIEASERF
ncbi:SRA-YDG domain-containing protein [Macrophomina phaseolina MS6]|uniref:SRA-YDG domain-containing protein n=2 Tax=Macrophomina phaseolina TaxID=35725 RepID=K2RUR9_MACPH|nr:SRA-YDG domain-containing protein [Macrophomina phaseolina MS6]KAH7052285.1 PUA-like domain-containing protein [Macrophomina phaseolina]